MGLDVRSRIRIDDAVLHDRRHLALHYAHPPRKWHQLQPLREVQGRGREHLCRYDRLVLSRFRASKAENEATAHMMR